MYRRYVLRDLKFKMKASGLDAAFKSFLHYFRNVEEINIKGMENIEDAFIAFDFGIIQEVPNIDFVSNQFLLSTFCA